uniref:F-box domain-containing protein n=1 Tax=Mesocestoides corti TaxID=53468 RepID=A0A5K3EPK7_MESCO
MASAGLHCTPVPHHRQISSNRNLLSEAQLRPEEEPKGVSTICSMDREASRPHCGVEAANVSKGDLARPYLKQKPIKKSKPQSTRDGKHELINVGRYNVIHSTSYSPKYFLTDIFLCSLIAGPMDSRKMTPIREGGGVREDRISPLRSNLKEHPPAKQKSPRTVAIEVGESHEPGKTDSTYDGSHFEAENRGVRRIYAPRSRVMPSFAATCAPVLSASLIEDQAKDNLLPEVTKKGNVMDKVRCFESASETDMKLTHSKPIRIVRVGERTELSRASSFGAYRSPRVQSIPQRLSPTGCVFSLQENDKLSQSLDSHTSQDFDFGSCKSCDGGEKIISSKSSLNPYFETTVQVTAGQNEESTDLKQYRPAGGVAIYTQAPKLLQEIKERSKKLHSCLYGDAQSEHRPPTPRSEQLLPRIEKNLDDVQNLPPLPADLNKDLSHALPCLGRERPKRTARLPARYAKRITQVTTSATTNDTHIPNSDNSTEV